MSPRKPTWSEANTWAPTPTFMPQSLRLTDRKSLDPGTFCLSRPKPPETYGRMPPPVWPPIGTPTSTLPINDVTLFFPNRFVLVVFVSFGSKKLGVWLKSTSNPTMPWPIQPAFAPQLKCSRFFASLPKVMPPYGVKSQSACATPGNRSSTAVIKRYFLAINPPEPDNRRNGARRGPAGANSKRDTGFRLSLAVSDYFYVVYRDRIASTEDASERCRSSQARPTCSSVVRRCPIASRSTNAPLRRVCERNTCPDPFTSSSTRWFSTSI